MLRTRSISGSDDFWRLRAFLRTLNLLEDRRGSQWPMQRLDYWRWHVLENVHKLPLDGLAWVWERGDEIVAAMTCDDPGEAYFHIHPEGDSAQLVEQMVVHAEAQMARSRTDGTRSLTLWARAGDEQRQALYTRHGYTRGAWPESVWQRTLDAPPPAPEPPPGYSLRSLGDASELPARSWLSWRAFHPDEPDSAYEGWGWYPVIQRIPLYRRDLDLVAVDARGTLAAFCTLWYDDVTRSGMFEPVGVEPAFQRRGLGRALLLEGMRRLHALGGRLALVSGFSQEANGLYEAVMGGPPTLYERWQRTFAHP